MSIHKYDPECKGCRPAMLNVDTREWLPDDHPHMQAVLSVWNSLNRLEREAWHRVTCQNSRLPGDMRIASDVGAKMQAALNPKMPTTP